MTRLFGAGQLIDTGIIRELQTNLARSLSLSYLLNDAFTTTQAAPLTSPRTCEPGPGQLTITDASNIISIASGQLVVNGTPAATSGVVSTITYARSAGKAFLFRSVDRTTAGSNRVGLDSTALGSAGTEIGGSLGAANITIKDAGNVTIDTITIATAPNDLAFICRSVGGFLFVRNGTTGTFKLIWVYNAGSSANLYAKLFIGAATAINSKYDNFQVLDLPAPFNSDYGPATNRTAVTANGTTSTMTADALVEHTITAATGVDQEIEIRRAADTSSVVIKMLQVAATIGVYTRTSGGVDTLVGSTAAQTWTNATQYRVAVTADGTGIRTVVNNVAKNAVTTSINQTQTGVKVNGNAGTDLICWPLNVTFPNGL